MRGWMFNRVGGWCWQSTVAYCDGEKGETMRGRFLKHFEIDHGAGR